MSRKQISDDLSAAARAMGRKGGKRSLETMTKAERVARAKKASIQAALAMTPEQRSVRAKKAVEARIEKAALRK